MIKIHKGIFSEFKLMFIPHEENNYKPEFLKQKILFFFVVTLLILKLVTIPLFIYLPKSAFFADITKTALMNFTNQERESLGIGTLKEDSKLNEAAYLKARDMIEKDYFSHESKEGLSPWYWFKKTGYNYQFAGENLAIGFLDSEEVHQAWLNSSSHRKNLLNPIYKEVGIAVLKGDFQGRETTVVVQLLGTSPVATSLPKEEPKTRAEIPPSGVREGKQEEETPSQSLKVLSPVKEKDIKDAFTFNIFRFISFDYNDLIQSVTYGLLILIIISLIISILIKPDIQDKSLILRAIIFIVLLSFSSFFDKEVIIQIIPHNFIIY